MPIVLNADQEKVLVRAIESGLAQNPTEALERAIDALRERIAQKSCAEDSVAAAARRIGSFGQRNQLSLNGITIKQLLRDSRP